MKVFIVGSGGREHALAQKISESHLVSEIFSAPGNAGIAEFSTCFDVGANDLASLLEVAKKINPDLTVVGPEAPLVSGIADLFWENGFLVFGPDGRAAQLEGSKVFSKEIMQKYNIPTAISFRFSRQRGKEALDLLEVMKPPYVIKVDGLAAGKGVIICQDIASARSEIRNIFNNNAFGSAGDNILLEEHLTGQEISILAIASGTDFIILPPSQDHKRIYDGDRGPNTGGMGAYAPVPFVSAGLIAKVTGGIISRTLEGLVAEGINYQGVLYAGLMLTDDGPKVLEFNVRFGDPEAQALLPLIDGDILEVMYMVTQNEFPSTCLEMKSGSCVCVVIASRGYPETSSKGDEIFGLNEASKVPGVYVFHAGTLARDGAVYTNGGRVLGVSAVGRDFRQARSRSYEAVGKIRFDGMQYRSDIGKAAMGVN
ncbi:MAG: phosphoribosylamine--glycine ligase [Actinobacteria bacterium]|nr:phosphoribosylamine--glycine ligase [Actinomycetota bacterium]